MTPFVNIHTHKGFCSETIIALRSYFLNDYSADSTPPFSIGIHPWNISFYNVSELETLKTVLIQSGAAAIGECGLDRTKKDFEAQKIFFEAQLQIAETLGLPVIIHAVKAYDQLLFFRKKYQKTVWIVHGFTGNSAIATALINQTIILSFGAKLLVNNSKLCNAFLATPLHALFLETDEADISIQALYKRASELRNISETEIKEAIFLNYKRCFKDQYNGTK